MIWLKIVIVLVLSLICGILYRLGGWEKGNRLFRILGCPFITLVAVWALLGFNLAYWWAYLLTFGASVGAISAYWGLDEKKYGYWAHGLGLALALLPIAYISGHWWGFAIRSVVLIAGITLWSEYTSIDWIEERGRGVLIVLTLLFFLI